METLDDQLSNGGSLSAIAKQALLVASKWAKFLSIIGFIGVGIMVIAGIFIMFQLSNIPVGITNGVPLGLVGFLYVAMALLYFFPVYYLFQFANNTKNGISSNSNESIEIGLVNLKSMFKFIGIFTVVILSIYALIFLLAFVVQLVK
ncbi:MAG: hypothetical protein FGM14_11205 [Flavobacteriales bacterium]|nr:hypothetical protein [Flavobacteriales bacterium]